jgi:poly-gamma-glutamate capsule biosynthesis protein CapA/YwtB (metallophosphatase superfamily)
MIAGTPMKIRGFLAFVTFGVILLVSARIYPQVSGATFTGSVSDASGPVNPDAQISIKNVATAVTRNLAADTAGFYLAPNLPAPAAEGQAPGINPLMPPERELAMKIKGPFTLAGVGDILIRHPFGQLAEPGFQNLVKHLRDADVGFANVEGTLIDYDNFPHPLGNGLPKGALTDLKSMGIRMVTTANNHSLDSYEAGVFETIRILDAGDIAHAGTGGNLQEARAPAFLNTPKGVVGLVGVYSIAYPGFQPHLVPGVDEESTPGELPSSAATYRNGDQGGRPGANVLDVTPNYSVSTEEMAALRKMRDSVYSHRDEVPGAVPPVPANEPKDRLSWLGQSYKIGGKPGEITYQMNPRDLTEILRSIRNGKQYSDFMLVTIHCHQNNYVYQQYGFDHEVPDFLAEFAHRAIDNGADAVIGHGVHTIRPVEIYKGKPFFYGLSEFAWQAPQASIPQNPGGEATDGETRYRPGSEMDRLNRPETLENLLAESHYENGRLVEVCLYPGRGIPMMPSPEMAKRVLEKVQRLSQPFGTKIAIENGVGMIRVPHQESEAPGATGSQAH